MIVAVPVLEVDGVEYVAPHFRSSRRIALYDVNAGDFTRLDTLSVNVTDGIGELLEHLAQRSVDLVVVYEGDEDSFSALAKLGVRVHRTSDIRVSEALKKLGVRVA